MKTGKVTESVLKRSVLKQIKSNSVQVKNGAGVGEDCAVFASFESDDVAACVNTVTGPFAIVGSLAVHAALNNLAAGGGIPEGLLVSAVFPKETEEPQLRAVMAQIGETAGALDVPVVGGHTEISGYVLAPILTVTALGRKKAEHAAAADESKMARSDKAKPGQDVVITKWIGLSGTALLATEKRQELLSRYPARFVDEAAAFTRYLSVLPEAAAAGKSGVRAMHDASGGGIFAALWEFAEAADVGLEIDLKKLPIRQETVELCDFFDVNPYEMQSGGCLVMAADNGYDLVRELEKHQIPAVVAGKVTASHDRVVINEEERRFLEPFRRDGINQVFTNQEG